MSRRSAIVCLALAALATAAPAALAAEPSYAIEVTPTGPLHVGEEVTLTPVVSNVPSDTHVRCFMAIELNVPATDFLRMQVASDGCEPWTFTMPAAPEATFRIYGHMALGVVDGRPQFLVLASDSYVDLNSGGTPAPFVTNYPVQSWSLSDMVSTSTPRFGEPITVYPPATADGCQLQVFGGFELAVTNQWSDCKPWTLSLAPPAPQSSLRPFGDRSDTRVISWTGASPYSDVRPDAGMLGAMYGETYNTHLGLFEPGRDDAQYTSNLPAIFGGPDRVHGQIVGESESWSFAPILIDTASGKCRYTGAAEDLVDVADGRCASNATVQPWLGTTKASRTVNLDLLDDDDRVVSSSMVQISVALPMSEIVVESPSEARPGEPAPIGASTDAGAPATYEITAQPQVSTEPSAAWSAQSTATTIASGYFYPELSKNGNAIAIQHAFPTSGRYVVTATFTDVGGNSSSGTSVIDVTRNQTDATPPTVSPPKISIVSSQRLGSTAKVRVSWPAATDASGIASYRLQKKKGAGSWTTVTLSSPIALSAIVSVERGATYAFRLRATDDSPNHNVSAWVTAARGKLKLVQENAASVRYASTWRRVALSGSSGGYVKYATAAGAKATYAFTGSAAGLVVDKGPRRGKAEIWLDGTKVATVDLYSARAQKKLVVWASRPMLTGSHVLELRVTGTKNAKALSTRVDLDAFLVWAAP